MVTAMGVMTMMTMIMVMDTAMATMTAMLPTIATAVV
jgi:hypothetical protein